jgi:hypothetical protein
MKMKKLYTLLLVAIAFSANAQIITKWDFDASSTAPTTGTGTATLIGGVTENLQTSTGSCNCAFVGGNPSTGKAYTTTSYPAASSASGTSGIQFNVSTVGSTDIYVYIDVLGSKTASKYVQFQYTTDGSTWTNAGTPTTVPYTTSSQWVTISQPLSDAAGKSNFAFRVVSVFAPSTSDYAPVASTSSYATTGALRYDNVIVSNGALSTTQNSISGLKVYPNPVTNGNLFITSDSNETKSVAVYDVLGKQVLRTVVTNQPINVSSLNSGVYIVKITEEGKTATRKLVIR